MQNKESNREDVLKILKQIVHPATGKDIVTMGLVTEINHLKDTLSITLAFPSPRDPLINSIKNACHKNLQENFGAGIQVNITSENKMAPEPKIETSQIKDTRNIIAVASGKGGVGKSTVAVNLAVATALEGYRVGLIDADIFGPSIPKMFGCEMEKPLFTRVGDKDLLVPIEKYGVKMLSVGLFIDPRDPTIWRGPIASNALKQLINDAEWGALDYLFIDLPPGTSDIHLTLVQTLAVTGAIIVTTPQDVALNDAMKGIGMFRQETINVPILGIVENMSWFTPLELPDNKYYIFGKGGGQTLADKFNLILLGQIPIVQSIRESGDKGVPQVMENSAIGHTFKELCKTMVREIEHRNADLPPTQKVEIKTRSFIHKNK